MISYIDMCIYIYITDSHGLSKETWVDTGIYYGYSKELCLIRWYILTIVTMTVPTQQSWTKKSWGW